MFPIHLLMPVLRLFKEMLHIDFIETGNEELDAQQLMGLIGAALAEGKLAEQVGDCTPLMLYTFFNITDERLNTELNQGVDYIKKTIQLPRGAIRHIQITQLSALDIAMAAGAEGVLSKLLETEHFNKDAIEKSAFLAVYTGRAEGLSVLSSKGIDLFAPKFFNSYTILFYACMLGRPRIYSSH